MAEPFDLARVNRNWDLAARPPASELPGRLAAVEVPLDAFVAARADLASIRELIAREAPEDAATLGLFVRRVEEALADLDATLLAESQLRAASEAAGEAKGAPAPVAGPQREALHKALFDLEDLLEVFLFIMKKGG